MRKQTISFILCFVILIGTLSSGLFALTPSLDNFKKVNSYVNGHYDDVKISDWFSPNVAEAYELGLMIGSSETYFNAKGNVTIAEAITMAARIHLIYTTGSEKFNPTTPWYQSYVDYALQKGIIKQGYSDYGKTATRAEFAAILAGALSDDALPVINQIDDGSIPDVAANTAYGSQVYRLYRAGILAGNDSFGTFTPDSNIARAAAAAIVTRMANASLRVEVSLEKSVPSSFSVRFIDVGQADAALVLCDGKSMLIDGGNADDSDLIYTYLKKLDIKHLDFIVATHAHEDHVGGLSAPLNTLTVGKVYAPKTQADTKAYLNFLSGVQKQKLTITTPVAGDKINLGSSEITFLAPVNETYDDINNTSIVLRIVYGETSFLFAGDAERESETDIIDAGYTLESTVLKVGHHGGETSTSYVFLREIMPQYAIISVGKDNSYGHPTEEVLSRLRDADVKLYRTDIQGDIIATSDGNNVTFVTTKNQNADTNPTIKEPETEKPSEKNYIGNKNTLKFHLPSCGSLPLEKNRIYFDNRQEAIKVGYVPCKICNP